MADDSEQHFWETQTKKDLITIKPFTKVYHTQTHPEFLTFVLAFM